MSTFVLRCISAILFSLLAQEDFLFNLSKQNPDDFEVTGKSILKLIQFHNDGRAGKGQSDGNYGDQISKPSSKTN